MENRALPVDIDYEKGPRSAHRGGDRSSPPCAGGLWPGVGYPASRPRTWPPWQCMWGGGRDEQCRRPRLFRQGGFSLRRGNAQKAGTEVRCLYLETGSGEAEAARARNAKAMGLPLEVIDARAELENVCRPFAEAYRGETPSPSVLCNPR